MWGGGARFRSLVGGCGHSLPSRLLRLNRNLDWRLVIPYKKLLAVAIEAIPGHRRLVHSMRWRALLDEHLRRSSMFITPGALELILVFFFSTGAESRP